MLLTAHLLSMFYWKVFAPTCSLFLLHHIKSLLLEKHYFQHVKRNAGTVHRTITITKQNKPKNPTYIQSIFSVDVQTHMADIFLEINSARGKCPAWKNVTLNRKNLPRVPRNREKDFIIWSANQFNIGCATSFGWNNIFFFHFC